MTEFKSTPVVIETEAKEIFSFLSDFNNFGKLMPEQVINWQSTTDNCSFTIKGMADLAMHMEKKEAARYISYASDGKSPFPFQLNFDISGGDKPESTVQASLHAKLNPMLKMMASRPLQNFINLLTEKLKDVMERG